MTPEKSLPHLRVFLASPGDVDYERKAVVDTLEKLRIDPVFRKRVTLEMVAWEQGSGPPMLGTMTPQAAISHALPKPCECDIVLVILWSRMGTPLPDTYLKPNGEPYLSGTEWEFENALEGNAQRASLRQGLHSEALERYEEMVSVSAEYGGEGEGYQSEPRIGLALLAAGDVNAAAKKFETLITQSKIPTGQLYGRYGQALIAYKRGQKDLARALATEARHEIQRRTTSNVLLNLITQLFNDIQEGAPADKPLENASDGPDRKLPEPRADSIHR